jgi:hypothetical protein
MEELENGFWDNGLFKIENLVIWALLRSRRAGVKGDRLSHSSNLFMWFQVTAPPLALKAAGLIEKVTLVI